MSSTLQAPAAAPCLPLLLTMGDAAGIGPEIIVQAFVRGALDDVVVVGDPAVLRRAGAPMTAVLEAPGDWHEVPPGCLPVLVPPGLPQGLAERPLGVVHADCGRAAAVCIEAAVRWLRAGLGSALVTAPIHKAALAAAGVPYPGHTEMLQALAVDAGKPLPPVRMMLANDDLCVVLATIHLALRDAIALLDYTRVLDTIRIAHRSLLDWGLAAPRIAVAGLNPHAGEGGLFGDEEQRFIAPAVAAAASEGIQVSGPYPPDTVFMRARQGAFDLVVAMTHDHGLIPVKLLGVEQGVNITVGLPFVRTSPDHGTAFDIAGRGQADPSSLMAALRRARLLSAG